MALILNSTSFKYTVPIGSFVYLTLVINIYQQIETDQHFLSIYRYRGALCPVIYAILSILFIYILWEIKLVGLGRQAIASTAPSVYNYLQLRLATREQRTVLQISRPRVQTFNPANPHTVSKSRAVAASACAECQSFSIENSLSILHTAKVKKPRKTTHDTFIIYPPAAMLQQLVTAALRSLNWIMTPRSPGQRLMEAD